MRKRRAFLANLGLGLVLGGSATALSLRQMIAAETTRGGTGAELKDGEIQHMVIFDLKHSKDSAETLTFLKDAKRILTAIPTVRRFQVFRQVSPKNDYDFGFSMVFSSRADYETYNRHPDHVAFVEERWKKEVERFLEIDFASHPL